MGWEIVECRCTVLMLCSVMSMWLVVDMISGAHKLHMVCYTCQFCLTAFMKVAFSATESVLHARLGSRGCLYTGSCVEPMSVGMRALSMERRS